MANVGEDGENTHTHTHTHREVAQLCPTLCDPWIVAHQAPQSMGFSRHEYWSGLPFPSPMERTGNPYTLLVRLEIGTAIMEDCMESPPKIKLWVLHMVQLL